MALSSLDKENVSRLMESLAIRELDESKSKDLMVYSASFGSKLKFLFEQSQYIQEQAIKLIENAELNKRLHEAKCQFKKVYGKVYHFYTNDKDETFCSIIGPDEWKMYKTFVGSFYLGHDGEFIRS